MTPALTPTKQPKERPALFTYGYVASYPAGTTIIPGQKPNVEKNFANTLRILKDLAMPENWEYSNSTNVKPFPILYNYLLHTFARVQEEGKIAEKDGYSCFNTGLVTKNQEEIFMLFKRTSDNTGWYFIDFCKDSSNSLIRFSPLPERATYFTDNSQLIYDTRLELRVNIDHIVEDAENFARFPDDIRQWPKHQIINTFRGAVDHAKKRVKRNYLTAIPQYYRGKYTSTPQLQLLLPLCLRDPSKADLALAVFKNEDNYSGRTCLTLDMAINNARLITKPDDEWLRP
ncbi:MAG: DUF3825 domain-containing protein [Bacteroidetes bacterium]|nr:DUF3825 domain-containing protein [Bacteroidota bacterium]